MIITSLLGETREVEPYIDGSYTCPFCGGAVLGDWVGCRNPACDAGPGTVEAAQERKATRERRAAEAAERERANEVWRATMDASREADRLRRIELREEAEREGYCVKCILQNPAKRVRHRDPNFHDR